MYKTYWQTFGLGICGVIFPIILIVLIWFLTSRGLLKKKYFVIATIALLLTVILGLYLLIPCIKDHKYVSGGKFLEDDALVVEFTYIKGDPDGNGQTQYSKPKFFIESKNEYIVLNAANVEQGKKYRIRYLPNTKICEIIKELEE